MSIKKDRSRGRPPVDSELLRARVGRAEIDALDSFAADQPDTPSRPEAIRRLLRDALIGLGYMKP